MSQASSVKQAPSSPWADRIFAWLAKSAALLTLGLLIAILASLTAGAWPAIEKYGLGFLTTATWDPVKEEFGGLVMIYGTLMTSLTTLMVLIALFYFGGEIIHAFAYTLIIGVVVGTYSSIFIASTAAIVLGVSKQDLMPVVKEGADQPDVEVLPERFRN